LNAGICYVKWDINCGLVLEICHTLYLSKAKIILDSRFKCYQAFRDLMETIRQGKVVPMFNQVPHPEEVTCA
jgi:hypothetical protein